MSISVFDHPFLSGLFGDQVIVDLFDAPRDIAEMVRFEIELASAQSEAGLIPRDAALAIRMQLDGFVPDMARLREKVALDGVVVPELVRQLRFAVEKSHAPHIHFGATSQDVIDTSLMVRCEEAHRHVLALSRSLIDALDTIDGHYGRNETMGYTRMQPALPIHVTDRIASWRAPLLRCLERIENDLADAFCVQLGGPVGTLAEMGGAGEKVRASLAAALGLHDASQWHSQRDRLVASTGNLAGLVGVLGKMGQDVALMAQSTSDFTLTGGGTSSAMAHKSNPVAAETLVTLARFTAIQMSSVHLAMVHEQERSGSSWMLEWLSVPQIYCATAAALNQARRITGQIVAWGTAEE